MQTITHSNFPQAIESLLEKLNDLESYIKNQRQPEKVNDLMNAEEAAEFLRISRSALYGKTCRNKIPFKKMEKSNKVLFSRAELTAWLAQGKQAA